MTTPTEEQSAYLREIEDVASILQKAQINFRKCPKARLTQGYVKARLKTIEEYWESIKQANNNLMKCTQREQRGELPYFLNDEYYKHEEMYLCLHADLTDIILQKESQQILSETTNTTLDMKNGTPSLVKLPRIQLPTFTGKYEDWPTYQDLFTALVHNNSYISNVQKLHYLKTSVSGEAELLLRHIQVTDTNYTTAWELLKGRFGNKKMIVNTLLKRLFSQRKLVNQSAMHLKSLLDITTECINSLNNLQINTDSWDPVIVFLVTQKLDSESLKDWEQQAYKDSPEEMPTWNQLKKFLEVQFRTLELISPVYSKERNIQPSRTHHATATEDDEDLIQSAHASMESRRACTYCKGDHYIFNCKDFVKQPLQERREFVQKGRLCYNCLVPNHNVFMCRQRSSCRVCGRKHHSLLHETKKQWNESDPRETEELNETIQQEERESSQQPEEKITSHFAREQHVGHQVLLATASVKVMSSNGVPYTCRALIDQGSEASFVTSRVVELLGLQKTQINGAVSGVGEGLRLPLKYKVNLTIKPRFNDDGVIGVKAYVLKSVSTMLPSKQIKGNWSELRALTLADPTYNIPGKIDLLLGADIFGEIIEDGLVKTSCGVVAQKTRLGWILSGQRVETPDSQPLHILTLHVTSVVKDDNDMLRKFWEIETESYNKKKLFTREEEICEEIYKNTTRRSKTGRFIVHLPLKQNIENTVQLCGETKQLAIRRFKQLEKKFESNAKFKEEYVKVINEYKAMGHMKNTNTEGDKNTIFLPHQAVIREDKETTKVRVVFDASSKGSNGYSLNDTMMVGPVLQPDLRSLIIGWRQHKFCVVGDIVKMYRMVEMTEQHTNLQRLVWRDNPADEIEAYNLTTVTFGTAAAPFLAVRSLHQLADDEMQAYPDTAPLIKNSFYMDDLMLGASDAEKLKKICDEIRRILRKGGFEMQKWSSNCDNVLEFLQEEQGNTIDKIEIKQDKVVKILGLTWDRKDDIFKITVTLPDIRYPLTKRNILSDIARLFDPFGWLSPVIITAKIMIQKLWLSNLGWDDELPPELSEEWIHYRERLFDLKVIAIKRWLNTVPKSKDVQLHGFADASRDAYAAVVYLRVVDEYDEVKVTLIAARTKVAPLKQLSIPKLELCAATLLTALISDVAEILKIPKERIFAWSDSTVVLSWLQSQPSRWHTFVANRVADIQRELDNSQWKHVQSADNPADIASRGIKPDNLATHRIWWTGPDWLNDKTLEMQTYNIASTDLEMKKTFNCTLEGTSIYEQFSTISRLKRVLGYCRRMLKKEVNRETYLTTIEMERVLKNCIKYYQNLVYGEEILDLKKRGTVKKRSSLVTLAPFLDESEILRVGGRLQNSDISDEVKHPIIIPSNQHLTKLLISEAHVKTLHGGIQLMMTYIRSRYWVIGLKSAVRKCIHSCKTCVVYQAKVKTQLMGQLPAVRVNPHRAFINSGVDYAGPVLLRTSKGRGNHATKGYICLFVCMSTRAIHLEAVTDLTSQAFLAAFRRFVARRGRCLHLWSDNGTNFVSAAKELRHLFEINKSNVAQEIAELLANDGTTWHFIPPRMPNYGGLWEAGVQSAKKHLTRINKDTKLTYEEMSTLLTQIEACLNSRPLCRQYDAESPLTPGHFLVGEALVNVPDLDYTHRNINLLTRWQLIQKMTQDFWCRWQSEYLHTLQQRYKWQDSISSPAIGDIVILKEENLPPTKWPLGKIIKLHPGSDNLVRVVTLQCKGKLELKRPLSKVIPLPQNPTDD